MLIDRGADIQAGVSPTATTPYKHAFFTYLLCNPDILCTFAVLFVEHPLRNGYFIRNTQADREPFSGV